MISFSQIWMSRTDGQGECKIFENRIKQKHKHTDHLWQSQVDNSMIQYYNLQHNLDCAMKAKAKGLQSSICPLCITIPTQINLELI